MRKKEEIQLISGFLVWLTRRWNANRKYKRRYRIGIFKIFLRYFQGIHIKLSRRQLESQVLMSEVRARDLGIISMH